MEDYIKERLIEVHKNSPTDRYGQLSKSTLGVHNVFGKKANEVLDYIKENPNLISVSTYGASYGTYKAIDNIICKELRMQCKEAFAQNQNRWTNLNKW